METQDLGKSHTHIDRPDACSRSNIKHILDAAWDVLDGRQAQFPI